MVEIKLPIISLFKRHIYAENPRCMLFVVIRGLLTFAIPNKAIRLTVINVVPQIKAGTPVFHVQTTPRHYTRTIPDACMRHLYAMMNN